MLLCWKRVDRVLWSIPVCNVKIFKANKGMECSQEGDKLMSQEIRDNLQRNRELHRM
jgi:hypothetical protein